MLRRPTLLAALLLLALPCIAQELAQRLILKDGSFQSVTRYEVHGDRVRYLSAERDEWEEIPSSLVDWPATDKYAKDRAAGASAPEAVQLDKEIEAERERAESLLPQVAPGLRIPEDAGVFLFDEYKSEPQLDELQQTAGDVRSARANILRGALNPIGGIKQSIEIEGAHATVQSHVGSPSLFINIDADPLHPDAAPKNANRDPQQPQQPQQAEAPSVPYDRFRIVRTQVKNDKRVVGDIKRQAGKLTEEQHVVKTTISRVGGGWLKLTPVDPLEPGEYVLIEMSGQEGNLGKEGMNLFVWDFGVNPKAPANANPWRPDVKLNPIPPDKQ